MIKRLASIAIVLLAVSGCSNKRELPLREYLTWIHDPDHGLVQTRRVGNIQLTVKWMPPEYLAYQDMRQGTGHGIRSVDRDSLRRAYEGSYTFLFSIEPATLSHNGQDILLSGIGSYGEYADRVIGLNFNSGDSFTLNSGNRANRPVLATMENGLESVGPRNIIVVFPRSTIEGGGDEDLDFTFDDPTFDTGRSHFVFSRAAIDNVPMLAL